MLKTTARADAIDATGAAVEAAARDKAFKRRQLLRRRGPGLTSGGRGGRGPTEAHGEIAEPAGAARSRRPAPGAPRRSSTSASTATPCCARRALEIDRFDDALVDEVRPDGPPDARRVRDRARGHAGRRHAPPARLPDRARGRRRRAREPGAGVVEQGQGELRGGLPVAARRQRRGRAAGPRPRPRAGRARQADPRRGLRPGGARDPARDGPPGRRPDPRPHLARPAQAGHAHAARAARSAAASLRNVYLGTSEFAAVVLRALAESDAPAAAGRHPPGRQAGPRAEARAAAGRRSSPTSSGSR